MRQNGFRAAAVGVTATLVTVVAVVAVVPVVAHALAPMPVAAAEIIRCVAPATLVDGGCEWEFIEDGTFTMPEGITSLDILAVGGGGGGGGGFLSGPIVMYGGGGGGGGQVTTCAGKVVASGAELTVVIGAGGDSGAATFDNSEKVNGSPIQGDAGSSGGSTSVATAAASLCSANGGDGGGAARGNLSGDLFGLTCEAAANAAPGGRSGAGKSGGCGTQRRDILNPYYSSSGGGGGGAGGDGVPAIPVLLHGGDGGAGVQGYGGGGGGASTKYWSGGSFQDADAGSALDGGGGGARHGSPTGGSGTANTGGGGGGGSVGDAGPGAGGNGGTGVVIIRFAGVTNMAITITASTDTKDYDGTTASSTAPAADELFPGDTITAASCPQAFTSPDAAPSITLEVVAGCTVLDADGNDVTSFYTITFDTTTGTIEPATPDCDDTFTYTGDPVRLTCRGVDGNAMNGVGLPGTVTETMPPTNVGDHEVDFTFDDGIPNTGNYDSTGTAAVTITKADPVCTVTGIDTSYDTTAHLATGSCMGVKAETLAGLELGGTSRTDVGTYDGDPWTFTDQTGNYNDTNGTVDSVISKTQPTVTYTGFPAVPVNGTLPLSATVTPSWCNGSVAYTITPNPLTGIDSLTVPGPSVPTTGWRTDTAYTVTATYTEDATCVGDTDSGSLVVASPGYKAEGSGWTTYAGGQRANFGFEVNSVSGRKVSTYQGNLLWTQVGAWRVKAKLTWYGTATLRGATTGVATGTAQVSRWEPSGRPGKGRWVDVENDVNVTWFFQPKANTAKKAPPGSIAIVLGSFGAPAGSVPSLTAARVLTGLDNGSICIYSRR